MEAQAPYSPQGPRNLAPYIGEWLRTQGFTATETQPDATFASLAAHWSGPSGERFELDYLWTSGVQHPEATCRLQVRYPDSPTAETLFAAQRVRRVADVRQLVNGCVRYHNARVLAGLVAATT